MKIGANIKTLREEKKMTQKDLASKLFLSPQAISRYEKNEVEPNLDVIEGMAKIFECTTDEIIHGRKENKKEETTETVIVAPTQQVAQAKEEDVTKCHDCGRVIEDNETRYNVTRFKDGSRISTVICDECHNKGLELDKQKEAIPQTKIRHKKGIPQPWSNKKSFLISLIIGAIIFIVSLCLLLTLASKYIKPGVSVGLSFLNLYLFTSLLYCIFVDTVVRDMFFEISLASVNVPVYFISHDLGDSIVIAIPLKILSFLIGLVITCFLICFAIVISGLCSMFIYPFALINNSINTSKY